MTLEELEQDENPASESFLAYYKRLPEKSSTTIRFFDKATSGECYWIYESDAVFVAKEAYGGTTRVKTVPGQKKMDYVTLKKERFEKLVKDLLLVKQYRVEVYVCENKLKNDWSLDFKGSPGNLAQFEDLLFSNNNEVDVNNGVVGVNIKISENKNIMVGLAFINTNECKINLIENTDNLALSNFESILVQLAPKEAVISQSSNLTEEASNLRKILERNGILINERKFGDFDTNKNISNDLVHLLKWESSQHQNVMSNPEMEKSIAVSALAATIKYLDLISNEMYFGQFKIEVYDFGLFVKMDSSACRALHISQNVEENGSSNSLTILSVLDKCRTAQGRRLLAQYLRQPLLNKDKIEERLDLVEILVNDISLRNSLYEDQLRKIPDCQLISRKLSRKKANLSDCFRGYQCMSKMSKLIEELERCENECEKKGVLNSNFIAPLQALQDDFGKFVDMIESTMDVDKAALGDFIVKPEFDESLKKLNDKIKEIELDMYKEASLMAKSIDVEFNKVLKFENSGIYGHYLRLSSKSENLIRNKKELIIVHHSKDGIKFRTKYLEKLNDAYKKKRQAYEESQSDIVKEVIQIASGYTSCFEQLGNVLAFIDVMTSLSITSANNYIRPIIHPRGTRKTIFTDLRHPCVESLGGSYIPNDISFNNDTRFYIVTGPNMGGKSTYLRSVGVATLLAHIGCFVPASSCEISLVDAILARVGAGDCLMKGISTFMAEMIESSFILKTATSDSLVLIDELGRGTSTYDGFGLAYSISEHLAKNVKCFCVLATHFHELTALANEVPAVTNVHVSCHADENGLTMLYKIKKGSCDRSFGLEVAKLNKFPDAVIQDAHIMCQKLEDFSSIDDVDETQEGVEKRRQEKNGGLDFIDKIMEEAKELVNKCQQEKESDKEKIFEEGFAKIMEKVEECGNPYIKHILSSQFSCK